MSVSKSVIRMSIENVINGCGKIRKHACCVGKDTEERVKELMDASEKQTRKSVRTKLETGTPQEICKK